MKLRQIQSIHCIHARMTVVNYSQGLWIEKMGNAVSDDDVIRGIIASILESDGIKQVAN